MSNAPHPFKQPKICQICDRIPPPHRFMQPDPKSSTPILCPTHTNDICNPCWQIWIAQELVRSRMRPNRGSYRVSPNVKCAECLMPLSEEFIKLVATPELWAQHELLAEPPKGEWMECSFQQCRVETWHSDRDGIIWRCEGCLHEVCVKCEMSSHPGVECEAKVAEKKRAAFKYDVAFVVERERVMMEHKEEEDASKEQMEEASKPCPECGVRIEKNGGCEHMTCKHCGHEFCWQCLTDYDKIELEGSAAHRPECTEYIEDQDEDMTEMEELTEAEREELRQLERAHVESMARSFEDWSMDFGETLN